MGRIVVVDDCSRDGTAETVRRYLPRMGERLHLIRHETNQGVGGAYRHRLRVVPRLWYNRRGVWTEGQRAEPGVQEVTGGRARGCDITGKDDVARRSSHSVR